MCVPAIAAALPAVFGSAAATGATTAAVTTATAVGTALPALGASTAAGLTTAQMVSLGLSAAGTGLSAVGAYNQARTGKAVAEANAQNAELQAQDALRRGEKDAQEIQRRAASFKSSQRVSLAAKGLDLGYGTAADLQDQTDFFSQQDVATARTNARKEAWNLRAQRNNYQMEAAASRPWMSSGSTLLAGAGQVASRWYGYRGQ